MRLLTGSSPDACSKGKGLTGVMKRWGFAGQGASHGNTKAHRKAGSIGASARPARVHKNKKMSGRQGGLNKTLMSSLVLRIDTELDLVFVKGPVPGPRGGHVRLTDARNKAPGPTVLSLPYPAATDSALKELGILPREITLNTVSVRDPHAPVE